jgi:hypothetical protein
MERRSTVKLALVIKISIKRKSRNTPCKPTMISTKIAPELLYSSSEKINVPLRTDKSVMISDIVLERLEQNKAQKQTQV